MSKYIQANKTTPYEATLQGLDAGAATIRIEHNNGVIEVTNTNGAILMQAKNVPEGTFDAIWNILESAGDTDYRTS
jgi:hypothetical protein